MTASRYFFKSDCFNSRTLGRVRLPSGRQSSVDSTVSIHAPWEGCDLRLRGVRFYFIGFNSRTLGRVRRDRAFSLSLCTTFQFTHPGKGATRHRTKEYTKLMFQFTHPGKGATTALGTLHSFHSVFQFTHPGKGATIILACLFLKAFVSIHAPWEGCDF